MSRTLRLVGAPSSAGAYGPGQERAPRALRDRGLVEGLSRTRRVRDAGDVAGARFERQGAPEHNNASEVERVATALIEPVADALESGEDVLVLGGDCSVELGVVAGALRHTTSVGLVYVDLDADLTTARTGDGILDWMGVAHLLGIDGTHPALTGLGARTPMLVPADVVLTAVDRITADEQAVIDSRGVRVESLATVRAGVTETVTRIAEHFADREVVLVHVDVDVLRREALSIADNERYVDGLHPDELESLLVGLMRMPNARALTVCEVNPDRAEDEEAALDRLVAMLLAALG